MTDRPNILWLIADDAGWEDLGCLGHPTLKTPHIDSLAERGLLFTQAFVTSPQCSPSRSTLWTGKYAHTMRTEDLHTPLPEDEPILSDRLKEQGYFVGNIGKLHLGPRARNRFDFYSPWATAWPRFFKQRPADKPFFLCVGYYEPHRPYALKLTRAGYPLEDVRLPPYLPDSEAIRTDFSRYYTAITTMDSKIGALLDYLRRQDLERSTLIVFVSDNGLPFPRAKGFLYDPGIRVPLIVSQPGTYSAGTREQLITLLDLAPTMAALLDMRIAKDTQGMSFAGVIEHSATPGREAIFAERNWHDLDDHSRAMRTTRYKYIRNEYFEEPMPFPSDIDHSPTLKWIRGALSQGLLPPEDRLPITGPRPPEELYDLETDPNEFRNLATCADQARVLQDMRDRLAQWSRETDDVTPEKRVWKKRSLLSWFT